MFSSRAKVTHLWSLSVLCFTLLIGAPASAWQAAEPPGQDKVEPGQEHQHMGGMHMNFPMGEETCGPKYTYEAGPQGPDHWPSVCSTGKMQSPINIVSPEKLPISSLLTFNYQPADLDVINNCNQYRILVRFPANKWVRIRKRPYFLSELHFRVPGENAVNGKRPRMSVQLAHLSPEAEVTMVEVPVIAGKENPAMKVILEHIPAPGKESKVQGVKINPADFLPADSKAFYRVPGSLTAPICNEGVTWYVMKNPIEFSEAQIQAYIKYYNNTARPLQPANGRPMADSQ